MVEENSGPQYVVSLFVSCSKCTDYKLTTYLISVIVCNEIYFAVACNKQKTTCVYRSVTGHTDQWLEIQECVQANRQGLIYNAKRWCSWTTVLIYYNRMHRAITPLHHFRCSFAPANRGTIAPLLHRSIAPLHHRIMSLSLHPIIAPEVPSYLLSIAASFHLTILPCCHLTIATLLHRNMASYHRCITPSYQFTIAASLHRTSLTSLHHSIVPV